MRCNIASGFFTAFANILLCQQFISSDSKNDTVASGGSEGGCGGDYPSHIAHPLQNSELASDIKPSENCKAIFKVKKLPIIVHKLKECEYCSKLKFPVGFKFLFLG